MYGAYISTEQVLMVGGDRSFLLKLANALECKKTSRLQIGENPLLSEKTRISDLIFLPSEGPLSLVVHGNSASISGVAGMANVAEELLRSLDYSDEEELTSPGWHMHFETSACTTGLPGVAATELMVCGPNL